MHPNTPARAPHAAEACRRRPRPRPLCPPACRSNLSSNGSARAAMQDGRSPIAMREGASARPAVHSPCHGGVKTRQRRCEDKPTEGARARHGTKRRRGRLAGPQPRPVPVPVPCLWRGRCRRRCRRRCRWWWRWWWRWWCRCRCQGQCAKRRQGQQVRCRWW